MKQILITGHLGRDAVQKSGNSREFLSFSVGVSEKWRDAQGQQQEKTDWFSVMTTQKSLLDYLKRGTRVLVQGKLGAKIYRNEQTGQQSIDYSINADFIELLSAANNGQTNGQPTGAPTPTGVAVGAMAAAGQAAPGTQNGKDDLPF